MALVAHGFSVGYIISKFRMFFPWQYMMGLQFLFGLFAMRTYTAGGINYSFLPCYMPWPGARIVGWSLAASSAPSVFLSECEISKFFKACDATQYMVSKPNLKFAMKWNSTASAIDACSAPSLSCRCRFIRSRTVHALAMFKTSTSSHILHSFAYGRSINRGAKHLLFAFVAARFTGTGVRSKISMRKLLPANDTFPDSRVGGGIYRKAFKSTKFAPRMIYRNSAAKAYPTFIACSYLLTMGVKWTTAFYARSIECYFVFPTHVYDYTQLLEKVQENVQ